MVYEPVITTQGAPIGRDTAYDAAFDMLRQSSPQALEVFELLAHQRAHDALVAMQLERLRAGALDDQIKLDEK